MQTSETELYKESCFLVLLKTHHSFVGEVRASFLCIPAVIARIYYTCDHTNNIPLHCTLYTFSAYFPPQINVDHHIREKIKKSLEKPSLSCFNEAQKHVYLLMERDSCPRFLHSDAYLSVKHKSRTLWYI